MATRLSIGTEMHTARIECGMNGGGDSWKMRDALSGGRVSQIHHEFESQLADWHERYAKDPDREILSLYLLALEREENVVVAYDDEVLGRRLAAMQIPAGVRDLMRYALARVRRDEQAHVLDAQTALLQLGRPMVRVHKLIHETAGAMGGWTAAVRQHWRWPQAPLSRAAATVLLWAGRLTGRVPSSVRPHLDYLSFRDFCRYNVETEGTAWLCWQRLAELAADVPGPASEAVADMRRVADDEDRHRRVFATLASTLTVDDRLRDGVIEEHLAASLFVIGPHFVAAGMRGAGGRSLEGSDGTNVDDAPEQRAIAGCQIGF